MDNMGISRREFCQRLGFAYSTVTDWLNAEKYPRIDKIEMMANFFGISKADLVEPPRQSSQPPADGLPALSPREERDIERDLEDMMHSVAQADYKAPGDEEDAEALKAALRVAMIQAKRTAKKKYTPRKYRKDK